MQYDPATFVDNNSYSLVQYYNKCAAHSPLSDTAAFTSCLEENSRKSFALQHTLDNSPTTVYDLINTIKYAKPTVALTYTWTGTPPNRVCNVKITGVTLTTAQKNTITSALNTKFSNKVVLL